MSVADKIKQMKAKHEELEKYLAPTKPTKRIFRPRVGKSELWTRDQRQELAKLADEFLNERKNNASQT
jgi:hypothetical protein